MSNHFPTMHYSWPRQEDSRGISLQTLSKRAVTGGLGSKVFLVENIVTQSILGRNSCLHHLQYQVAQRTQCKERQVLRQSRLLTQEGSGSSKIDVLHQCKAHLLQPFVSKPLPVSSLQEQEQRLRQSQQAVQQ